MSMAVSETDFTIKNCQVRLPVNKYIQVHVSNSTDKLT